MNVSGHSARPDARPGPGVAPSDHRGAALPLAVFLIVIASRLPFLNSGYGVDPDAWRIATTARVIAATHRYAASRFPGFPVQEIVSALIARGGPLALNGAGALLLALGAAAFARSLRRLGSREAALGSLALAFTPVVFVSSTSALDYTWALGLSLVALDLALSGRAMGCGVLLGIATGCRISSLALALPLAIVLARGDRLARTRRIVRFVLATLVTTAVVLMPLVLTYGAAFLRVYDHGYPRLLYVVKNASVDVWGIPGTLALIAAALAFGLGRRAPRHVASVNVPADRGLIAAALVAVTLYVALFLRLPYEAGYLIPAIPFVILLLATAVERRVFVVVCLALLISPWCLKASEPGKPDSPPRSALAFAIPPAQPRLVLDVLHGPLIADHLRRIAATRYVDRVLARAASLPDSSVVAAYEWLPMVRERLGSDALGGVRFVYVPDADRTRRWRASGYDVYLLPGAEEESIHVNGASLVALGAIPLAP